MLINEQIQPKNVANPIHGLPSIGTDDLVQLMRIDQSFGTPRIANYIADAYDMINRQLPTDYLSVLNQTKVCAKIQAKLQATWWQRSYKRAVLHEAGALMADDYLDFDTIGQGQIRGENLSQKSERLRRIVNHCIADLTDKPRNRIKLL